MQRLSCSKWVPKSAVFLALVFTLAFAALYLKAVVDLPDELTLIKGREYVYNLKMPFTANISMNRNDLLKLSGKPTEPTEQAEQAESLVNGSMSLQQSGNMGSISLSRPILLKSNDSGSIEVNMKILGIIPLGMIKVDVVDEKKVMACGNTIGVKMELDGMLVIGMSYFENTLGKNLLPVKDSGIRPGDLIVEINGETPQSISDFIDIVQKSDGLPIMIKYKSNGALRSVKVNPERAFDDNMYHLGLWVRENTAGIGTLTFYDPNTNTFGALGHGITDIDTGALMPVGSGEILQSSILTVKKGRQGNPGELKGLFLEDKATLGMLQLNTAHGIFGVLHPGAGSRLKGTIYPIGVKSDAKPGSASILANISGTSVSDFNIQIVSIARQDTTGSKGMVIRITDERLLSATGGIVQGMSGCPIIQDGKIIGAVTHVLVNDPARGYGIFIENMLRHLGDISTSIFNKAS